MKKKKPTILICYFSHKEIEIIMSLFGIYSGWGARRKIGMTASYISVKDVLQRSTVNLWNLNFAARRHKQADFAAGAVDAGGWGIA